MINSFYPFVPEDLALLAEQYGFNDPCMAAIEKSYEFDNKKFPATLIQPNDFPVSQEQFDRMLEIFAKRPGLFENKDGGNINSKRPQWSVSAPLYQQLGDWFRREHKMNIYPTGNADMTNFCWCIEYNDKLYADREDPEGQAQLYGPIKYKDYEVCLYFGYKKAFDLLKERKND